MVEQNYQEILDFCDSIGAKIEEEKQKLPYHINVIDLLRAGENAHSRILMYLLGQENKGEYEILQSFLEFVKTKKNSFQFQNKNPKITSEKERIDVCIEDENYAIIIENKIHNARDQYNQIDRYIDKLKNRGKKEENIFVIYLTRDDYKDPENHSFTYKENFENRYINLNYKVDILFWLKENVLPNVRNKDVFLKSSLEQYIDHLEGMFYLRKIQEKMNQEIQKIISEKLNLGENPTKDCEIINQKIELLEEIKNQLLNVKHKQVQVDFLRDCYLKVKNEEKYKNLHIIDNLTNEEYPNFCIKLKWNNFDFAVVLEKSMYSNNVYYGLGRHCSSQEKNQKLNTFFEPILQDLKKDDDFWYGWEYTSYEDCYEDFKSFLDKVILYIEEKK